MRFGNLVIVGTSHIAAESIRKVEKIMREENPGIVALELDRKRLYALMHPEKHGLRLRDIKRVGFKGWLFSIIGAWLERRLGEQAGVMPGAEMLHAVGAAQQTGAKLALIDQDIEKTLRRFSETLSFREKMRLAADAFTGIVLRKNRFRFDLTRVPERKLIAKMMKEVRQRYPNIFKVLVTERNSIMAHRLAHLATENPEETIVAVVGAGHEKEIMQLTKKEIMHGLRCQRVGS